MAPTDRVAAVTLDDLNSIEQGLLGALLASERVFDEVSDLIMQEHFYSPVHARIFECIKKQIETGQPTIATLIAPLFHDDQDLTHVGGGQYIHGLANSCLSTVNAKHYARQIVIEYGRRQVVGMADYMRETAKKPDFSGEDMAALETLVFNTLCHDHEAAPETIETSTKKALEAMAQAQSGVYGLTTGLGRLDNLLRGLCRGRVYVAAGRPAMGKTALGLTMAVNAALAGKKVMFFSLEMGSSDLIQRIIARFSGVSVDEMNAPHPLPSDKQAAVEAAAEKVKTLPILIDHTQGITVANIFRKARRQKRKTGIDLVIIDYLGLVKAEDTRAQKVHQIEEITTGVKRLANTLNIPVVLLAQLNRGVELRDDKRPQLSDLRDSGAIEQDADVVMLLYREDYYLEHQKKKVSANLNADYRSGKAIAARADLEAVRGHAEIIVAKNRHGRTGIIDARFNGAGQVFHE